MVSIKEGKWQQKHQQQATTTRKFVNMVDAKVR